MSVVKRKWNASDENDAPQQAKNQRLFDENNKGRIPDAATAIDPCIQDCNAANWNATGHLQLPATSNHIQ
jgi:hypothetical protein